MKERRFVSPDSGLARLGDSVRRELRRRLEGSPSAIQKVREKNIELTALVAAGAVTPQRARAEFLKFASLMIAHVREHGPEVED
jgi:hypothetical protein